MHRQLTNSQSSLTNTLYHNFPSIKQSIKHSTNLSIASSNAQINTLMTYRSYLLQEMKCVEMQMDRDQAEANLMLHRVLEVQNVLEEEYRMLDVQLRARQGQLKVKNEDKDVIQGERLDLILKLKQVIEQQQRLSNMHKQTRQQAKVIIKQINEMKSEGEGTIAYLYRKNAQKKVNIESISSEIKILMQRVTKYQGVQKDLMQKQKIKLKQIQNKKKTINCEAQKGQKLKQSISAQKCEVNRLKNVERKLMQTISEIRTKVNLVNSSIQQAKCKKHLLQQNLQQINYKLERVLSDLQMQQRSRQNQYDKIVLEKQKINKNRSHLQELLKYIQQLKASHQKLSDVLSNCQKKDELQVKNILQKIKYQTNDQINDNNEIEQKNASKMLINQRKEIKNVVQTQPLSHIQEQNEHKNESILKNYLKFCNRSRIYDQQVQQQNNSKEEIKKYQYTKLQNSKTLKSQHRENNHKDESRQLLENQPAQVTKIPIFPLLIPARPSHNSQLKTYRLPENISQIIDRYRPTTDRLTQHKLEQQTNLTDHNMNDISGNKLKYMHNRIYKGWGIQDIKQENKENVGKRQDNVNGFRNLKKVQSRVFVGEPNRLL